MSGRPPARAVLTPRERQAVELAGQGLTNPEIADRLGISPYTASQHVVSATRKLVGRLTVSDDAGWTPRERTVFELLQQGLTDAAIADRLGIGLRSAETYASRVLNKAGIQRAHLAPAVRGRDTSGLTRRERQIADLLRRGLSNAEIADSLAIGVRTAETHVSEILRKLGKRSRKDLRT